MRQSRPGIKLVRNETQPKVRHSVTRCRPSSHWYCRSRWRVCESLPARQKPGSAVCSSRRSSAGAYRLQVESEGRCSSLVSKPEYSTIPHRTYPATLCGARFPIPLRSRTRSLSRVCDKDVHGSKLTLDLKASDLDIAKARDIATDLHRTAACKRLRLLCPLYFRSPARPDLAKSSCCASFE